MSEDINDVIRVIDDRVRDLSEHVKVKDERLSADIRALISDVATLKEAAKNYVSIERYRTVERIVLGGSGFILLAVLTALVGLVVTKAG